MELYLLTHSLEKIAQNIYRLDDFAYDRIPRHYEEALLVYMQKTGKKADLSGRTISNETIRRFNDYIRIISQYTSKEQAFDALAGEFSDTYFFYSTFNISGANRWKK